ncbi:hypothetical protein [Reyranella sp.]|uniref:hypothetical protein n=1 Tax=Reyranella sp. TaxID=1929291 RepID=UPI002F920633
MASDTAPAAIPANTRRRRQRPTRSIIDSSGGASAVVVGAIAGMLGQWQQAVNVFDPFFRKF